MTNEAAEIRIKQSKDWRQRLDTILQEMKAQQAGEQDSRERHDGGRHLAISITHLEDSIMRHGMRMKAIDETNKGTAPNPYPESYNPANAQVEPTSEGLKL
jgi:hypothetical protein